jgi:DNA repair exonuclease SbcCD ATPase subunit
MSNAQRIVRKQYLAQQRETARLYGLRQPRERRPRAPEEPPCPLCELKGHTMSNADKIATTLETRLQRIEAKAESAGRKLDAAFDATEESLELVDQTADRFLSVSAKLRGMLGAQSNFPPKSGE